MSNTEKELKACPFCGAEPYFESEETSKDFLKWSSVSCRQCTVSTPRRTSAEAIAAWNQRPASPLAEENKRLREALKVISDRGEQEDPDLNSEVSMGNYDDVFSDGKEQARYEAAVIARAALADTVAQQCADLPRSEPKEAGVLVLEAAYKAVQDAHLAKYIAEQEAAPAKSAPIFDPKWIQAAIDDRLPEGCVGIGQPDGTFKVMHLETQKEVGTLPPRPKSAPEAVAQVLASSLGATESCWGEAKGNAEGTAPVKTEAEGGWQPIETKPEHLSVQLFCDTKQPYKAGMFIGQWHDDLGKARDFRQDAFCPATHWKSIEPPIPAALGDL